MLFGEWAVEALEKFKRPYVKGNTYNGTYLQPVHTHLIPHFGNVPLDNILPIHVQEYINQAAKKYKPEIVKKDIAVLAYTMENAVDTLIILILSLCSCSTVSTKHPKQIALVKYIGEGLSTVETELSTKLKDMTQYFDSIERICNNLLSFVKKEDGRTMTRRKKLSCVIVMPKDTTKIRPISSCRCC